MATPLERMRSAGFRLSVEKDRLFVEPYSKLTKEQRLWLRNHRTELLAELAANNEPIMVQCWTPSGIRMVLEADSPEHAAWIQRMNPRPLHQPADIPPDNGSQSEPVALEGELLTRDVSFDEKISELKRQNDEISRKWEEFKQRGEDQP